MPNLEEFLGKSQPDKNDWRGWDLRVGSYGCQVCAEDVENAYFNSDQMVIKWVCSLGHESKVQLV